MTTNIWLGDEGKKSVNATGAAMLVFGLVTVMVRSETSPAPMVGGLKDLLMPISLTIKVSFSGGAVPLSVTKAPVVFKWSPGTNEVTYAVTVQPLGPGFEPGIEPFVKVTLNASFVIDPPQPLLLALPTNVKSVGNVSMNDAKLAAEPLALSKVMVRSEGSPALMVMGLKDLVSVGGMLAGVRTVKVSLAWALP